ncbi:MAG: hypothetical protein ABIH37_04610 [archaeon]
MVAGTGYNGNVVLGSGYQPITEIRCLGPSKCLTYERGMDRLQRAGVSEGDARDELCGQGKFCRLEAALPELGD